MNAAVDPVVASSPDDLLAQITSLALTDADQALVLSDRAIATFPDSALLHERRSRLMLKLRRLEEAETSLRRTLELADTDATSKVALARLLISQGRFGEAETLFEAALALRDRNAWRHELATLQFRLGDYQAAVAGFRGVATASPLPERRQELDEAVENIARDAAEGVPPLARRDLARATEALRNGQPIEAEALARALLARWPQEASVWMALRGALHAQGRRTDAEALEEAWRAAIPDRPAIVAASLARPLSARGLVFDPRDPLPVRAKAQALKSVRSPKALVETPDACLVIDSGLEPLRRDPIISVRRDGSDDFAVETQTCESFVLSLANAAVVGRGLVVTQKGEVIEETLFPAPGKYGALGSDMREGYDQREPGSVPVHGVEAWGGRLQFNPLKFADGAMPTTWFDEPAFLMAGPTDVSFGDWIWNFPPRLWLAEAARLDTKIVVNDHIPPLYIDMLAALGVPRERLLFRDPKGVSIFPRLYVPSWPGRYRLTPMKHWCDIYGRATLKGVGGPRRRLFLSRRNHPNHPLVNEPDVLKLFEARGFEAVCPEDLSFDDMRQLFARPACVAGPYGSALRNLVFCHEKPLAFVLMTPDSSAFLQGSALWLAETGVRFGHVIGRLAPGHEREDPRKAPWLVDLQEIEQALDRFIPLLEAQGV